MNCYLCKSKKLTLVHDKIREGKGDIYNCNNCEVNFLKKPKKINYKKNYETMLYEKSWNINKQIEVRSKSLSYVTKELLKIIEKNKFKKILELGSGCGSTLIDIYKSKPDLELACLEKNLSYNSNLKKIIKVNCYNSIDKINEKFDFVFGLHFIEHINEPVVFLKKLRSVFKKNTILYLITPNHDDFYMHNLPEDKKYLYKSFIYHIAHPFYYNKNSLIFILNKSGFKNIYSTTHQDYPITNFIQWYANGKPNKNIIDAQNLPKNLNSFNKTFIEFCSKNNLGSNFCSLSKKK